MAKVNKTFIIAEIGVNHNGSIKTAKKLIDIAKKCGADAVKFQTFLVDEIVTKYVKKANYQKLNEKKSSTQFEMLSKLEAGNGFGDITAEELNAMAAQIEAKI